MKKMVFFIMLILIVLLAASCTSSEPAAPEYEIVPYIIPALPPEPEPEPEPQIIHIARHHNNIILDGADEYLVQSGDTLSGIARRFYQDGSLYPLIMMASDDVVKDPDVIEPGMILTIPDLDRNLADWRAKDSMNSFFAKIADIEDQRGRYGTATLIRNHTSHNF